MLCRSGLTQGSTWRASSCQCSTLHSRLVLCAATRVCQAHLPHHTTHAAPTTARMNRNSGSSSSSSRGGGGLGTALPRVLAMPDVLQLLFSSVCNKSCSVELWLTQHLLMLALPYSFLQLCVPLAL